jgi:hypothetical protein
MKLDQLALAAAGAYLGVKLLATTSKSEFVRKAGLRFTDALVAVQIYIVVARLRDGQAAPVELPAPAVVQPLPGQPMLAPYVGIQK